MPKPRLPALKAAVTGATAKNPGRFKGRANPKVKPVGAPPEHLSVEARRAWRMFASRMPWLSAPDEAMLELASMIRGLIIAGEDVGVQAGKSAPATDPVAAATASQAGVTSPAATNDNVAAELRSLREEVAGMRKDNNDANAKIANGVGKTSKVLDDLTGPNGGDALTVVMAA